MKKHIFLYLATFGVVEYFAYRLELRYSFDSLKDYLDVLANVSAMVFTIMGIWIAFIYPNALSRLVDPEKIKVADFSEALGETQRLEAIVASILKSAFVLVSIMLFYLVKIFFYEMDVYAENAHLVKSFAVSFVFVLTIMQLEAVAQVMYSNIMFINDLHGKRESREIDSDI